MQRKIFITMASIATTFATYTIGETMPLKEAYADHFHVGAAISRHLFHPDRKETLKLAANQFNSITAENEMKWQSLNPTPNEYQFKDADNLIRFGIENEMYIVGHVLFWHNQTPDWLFEDDEGNPVSKGMLLKRMRAHVRKLADRYGDHVHAWDVINETFNDDGSLRDSPWTRILGEEFIEYAFQIAGEELPDDTELLYNDYSMTRSGRRDAVVRMVNNLQSKGIRIDGIGMQGHWARTEPGIRQIEASILAFAETGLQVHITELDIDMLPRHPQMWGGNADVMLRLQEDPKLDPYTEGLTPNSQKALAERYENIFQLFLKHSDKIRRVTFWGVTDADSWLNNWPIRGRTSHPLLFDRDNTPKPAFHAIIDLPPKPND